VDIGTFDKEFADRLFGAVVESAPILLRMAERVVNYYDGHSLNSETDATSAVELCTALRRFCDGEAGD
jgi:hypothetical protein